MIRAIKTKCRQCTSVTCSRMPIGSWATETEGCTKIVSEVDGDKFYHYAVEVKPQLYALGFKGRNVTAMWNEVSIFQQYIDDKPHGDHFKR